MNLEAKFFHDISVELTKARDKYPTNKHKLASLMEESGEVANAFLQHSYGKKTAQDLWKECVQTAVMAMRCATEGDASFPYNPQQENKL